MSFGLGSGFAPGLAFALVERLLVMAQEEAEEEGWGEYLQPVDDAMRLSIEMLFGAGAPGRAATTLTTKMDSMNRRSSNAQRRLNDLDRSQKNAVEVGWGPWVASLM